MSEDQKPAEAPSRAAEGSAPSAPVLDEANAPSEASAQQPTGSTSDYSWVFGLAFWILILAIWAYRSWHTDSATLLLNVTSADPLLVSGAVTHEGEALAEGTVQLTVMDAMAHKYIGSETLAVGPGGRFSTDPARPLATGVKTRKLQVRANFFGRTRAAEPKDRKPLVASETVYVNFTPTFGPGARLIVGCLTVPFLLLIFLFTGPLTKAKARLLFMITYGVTLFSCLIPIALTFWISRNPDLVEVMEQAPVGLLKGIGKGMENPQWLVNIGGAVVTPRMLEERSDGPNKNKPPTEAPGEALAPVVPATPTPAANTAGQGPSADASSNFSQVKGGLAIPLFVIMLAMLGAGINMTRKVPEIQKDYDSVAITWDAAVRAPIAVLLGSAGERVGQGVAATIRKDLIETYMYFLSAPFLAIAVYYLLQVIATSVAEPVLVVIAFATGLMSNTVIGSIIAFADATLKKVQQ